MISNLSLILAGLGLIFVIIGLALLYANINAWIWLIVAGIVVLLLSFVPLTQK